MRVRLHRRGWYLIFLFAGASAFAVSTRVEQVHLQYRRNGAGAWSAFIRNNHRTAATAYIAQATFRQNGKQKPTAFGGDSLGFAGGYGELPPGEETDTGHGLPGDAVVLTQGFIAVIYADGSSEGDEDVVAMLLSGRHRAYVDLGDCLPKLEQAATGKLDMQALNAFFESMKTGDQAEGAKLDELIDVPGVKHRYFMSAVPTQALSLLENGNTPDQAALVLAECKGWRKRLAESKPDIK